MKKYVVQPGDTLHQISKRTGVRIPLLLAANPQIQNPAQIAVGSVIVIPELGKPAKGAAGKPTTMSASGVSEQVPPYFGFVWPHQVQPGETWKSLSQKYGVTLAQLHHVNPHIQLDRNPQPGTVIYVPSAAFPTSGGPAQGMPASYGQTAVGHGMQPTVPSADSHYAPQHPPQQLQSQSASPSQSSPQEDSYGPHTHNPYRAEVGYAPTWKGKAVTETWYIDMEESSSLFTDSLSDSWSRDIFPEQAAEMRSGADVSPGLHGDSQLGEQQTPDEDGWSGTLTVRLDKEN